MDQKKTFDTVHHAVLLQKLRVNGIKGKELDWFTDYLFNRRQCVEYDGCKSDFKHVTNGVPHGSILGPLFFIILVNDMPTVTKRCKLIIYADDTVLFYADKDSVTIQDVRTNDADRIASSLRENNPARRSLCYRDLTKNYPRSHCLLLSWCYIKQTPNV